jgi:Zn-dependent M28 family amino/carboxypeptidase
VRLAFFVTGLLVSCAFVSAGCSHDASPSAPAAQRAEAAAPAISPSEAAPPASKTGGFDGQKAYEHVAKIYAMGPRPSESEALRKSQDYIRSQLQSYGCAIEEDDFHAGTPIGSVAMKNIIAKAAGTGQGIILLLTHYETLRAPNFIGADDPGSSIGVMLEEARLLCGKKQPLPVWIAFLDGEEAFQQWSDTDSIYGSRELAAKLAASGDLKKIKAVILADMVGPKDLKIRRESTSTKWLVDLVWQTAARLGYQQIFLPDETDVGDDHLAFIRRGVPAVDIIDLNDYPYWHTPEDSLDKISPRSLAIVGHVILESVNELQKKN